MTRDEMEAIFNKNAGEYGNFERIKQPIIPGTLRPDLYAFNLLDALVPGKTDIITNSEHDEYYLNINLDALAERIQEWQVIDLIRCGVHISEYDCLALFA